MKDRNVILGFLIGGGFEVFHFESTDNLKIYFKKDGKNYLVELEQVNFHTFIVEFEKVYKMSL